MEPLCYEPLARCLLLESGKLGVSNGVMLIIRTFHFITGVLYDVFENIERLVSEEKGSHKIYILSQTLIDIYMIYLY